MEDFVVVIGGLNRDVGGQPLAPLVAEDSNPGRVHTSTGGVGHNIAVNMARLGLDVELITVLGSDGFAKIAEEESLELGIRIDNSLKVEGSSATYLYINDHNGDMSIAINDMSIFDNLTPEFLAGKINLLNQARAVVVDTNIPAESVEWICRNCKAPVFVDTVSTIKAHKILPVMDGIHTLKPNRLEAELLSGIRIQDYETLEMAAAAILEKGIRRVFISVGEKGVYCAEEHKKVLVPCLEANMVNTTGAGDSFMAGITWAFVNGKTLTESAMVGNAVAAITIESTDTINPELKIEDVIFRANI